jgi:membrane protease YdiL (CAAX protease family)
MGDSRAATDEPGGGEDATVEAVPASEKFGDTPRAGRTPGLRGLLPVLALCLLPWGVVWLGLYRFGSAPLAFLLYHIACGVGGWLLGSPALPRTERVSPLRRRILLGVILSANVATVLLYLTAGSLLLDKPAVLSQMKTSGLPSSTYFWLFPYFALVNPLAEEYFWRGGIYARLRPSFPHWTQAALITSAFFGAWHWLVVRLFVSPALALPATLAIAGVGFLLTYLYEDHRRLIYPIALHALAADVPLLVLLYLVGR